MFILQACLTATLLPSFLMMRGPNSILSVVPNNVVDKDTVLQKTLLILRNRTYLYSCICNTVLLFMIQGAAFYLIEFMQDIFQITTMKAGTIAGILLAMTIIFGIIFGGIILDYAIKSMRKRDGQTCSLMEMCKLATKLTCVLFSLTAVPAPFLFSKPFINDLGVFCVCLSVVMLGICATIGPINNTILWSVDLKDRSFAKAISNVSLYIFGRVPAPIFVGFLKETWGWSWAYFYLGCHVGVALVFIVLAYIHAKKVVMSEELRVTLPSLVDDL